MFSGIIDFTPFPGLLFLVIHNWLIPPDEAGGFSMDALGLLPLGEVVFKEALGRSH